MTSPTADPKALAELVPVNALVAEKLRQLAAATVVHTAAPGDVLFREGDNDHDAIYVLTGEVALASSKGVSLSVIGGSDQGRYALAHLKPRQLSATAKTSAQYVRIDGELMDRLLTWDQVAGVEVSEIAGDAGWMARLLEHKAFHKLPPAHIETLLGHFEEVPVKTGQIILKQGEPGDYYYMIREGRCRVVRKPAPDQPSVVLADLGEGEGFGEESLISNAPRNATVAALSTGVLMRLAKRDFDALLKEPLLTWSSASEAVAAIGKGAVLVDVRLPGEFQKTALKGAVNVPLPQLRARSAELDPRRSYIVYCDTGIRSSAAAFILNERGFEVAVLRGGINSLVRPVAA